MAYDSSDKPGSNELDRNPDPITGAPGSHPLGTGIGTGSGALTGAALGMIGGPVGAAIGLIAGGITGALVGHEAGEYNDPTEDYSKAGQTHADPVAATTNPSGTTAGSTTASTGTTSTPGATSAMPGSASSGRYASLDEDSANHYRTAHQSSGYEHAADADFDADLAPAYGFGSEVSKHAATHDVKDYDAHDTDFRAGWDQVKGKSKLSYDQAKPAIQDAYNRSLKLHEERLNVNKDRVETGNVSLRKEIVTEQKTIEVPVQREEVVITTRSMNEAGGSIGESANEIRVPVSEERVNIDKQVVQTGEVSLDKKVINETKSVVDSVRKEVVKVDKTGDVKVNEESSTGR